VSGDGLAHDYAECSGNGECDRKTGECTCFDGFTGDACRYSACPNSCSGHGTCEYISEIAKDSTIQYNSYSDRAYDLWDAKKSRFCKCDAYWTGTDCSERMCPKGNDPLTTMSSDDLGGNTPEVQEVQTVTIRPQLLKNNDGAYVALGGDFTLTYTDAYNQEWTTRPIRVTTLIQETTNAAGVATGEIAITDSGTKISDTQRRFHMFELYDVVKIEGLAHATNNGVPITQTITAIDCTSIQTTACKMTLSPGFAADEAVGDGATQIKITLVNSDTGEIGVKRMLQELPSQVVPSITVDETIGADYNTFKITFSDAANSGDQHSLKCRAASCDSDGCQPRKKAIKGLFRYKFTAGGSEGMLVNQDTNTKSSVTDSSGGMQNFRTSAQGGSSVEIIAGSNGGGSAKAPDTVETTKIEWNNRYVLIPGKSGSAANLVGGDGGSTTGSQEEPANAVSQDITVYQIHDFDADSVGFKTGGLNTDLTNPKAIATPTVGAGDTFQSSATVAGPHIVADGGTPFNTDGFQNFVAGDRIWLSCASTSGSVSFNGYFKIVSISNTVLALDRSIPTISSAWDSDTTCTAKKIVNTVCEVEETVKGTSENAECSNRGNCDTQTGLCGCFAGYTGEDCSVQTVLV